MDKKLPDAASTAMVQVVSELLAKNKLTKKGKFVFVVYERLSEVVLRFYMVSSAFNLGSLTAIGVLFGLLCNLAKCGVAVFTEIGDLLRVI